MILFLEKRKDLPAAGVTCLAWDVEQWVGDRLPARAAHSFASWMEDVWDTYANDTDLTTGQALEHALEKWKGWMS